MLSKIIPFDKNIQFHKGIAWVIEIGFFFFFEEKKFQLFFYSLFIRLFCFSHWLIQLHIIAIIFTLLQMKIQEKNWK